jgi:hypothetical protein
LQDELLLKLLELSGLVGGRARQEQLGLLVLEACKTPVRDLDDGENLRDEVPYRVVFR